MTGQIEMAALGRPFALGMLYDACNEELDVGFTLWNEETLKPFKKGPTSQKKSEFGLATSDTTDSRNALIDVNESLKVGVLCGLIDIQQSAKYLIDMKKSKNQNRILLRYTSTTAMETLLLTPGERSLSVQDLFKKTRATHVVTGILKGANAFFVFDRENTDENNFRSIEGSIKAEVSKLQSVDVGGEANFKLSEDVKAMAEKLSCEFHGDFILNKNPKNFEDAINTYSELSKLLGENGENAVPVKVWLTPLKNLYPSASELKRNISDGLLRRVTQALESLMEMERKAFDEDVVQKIPQIEKKLTRFRNLCKDYREMLQNAIKEKIPCIRRGLEEEKSVKTFLDDQEKSPFMKENLEKWLKNAEKEMDVIKNCVIHLKKATAVQKETDLKEKSLNATHKQSLCFVFTSVKSEDPYLDQMDKYLNRDENQPPDQVTPPSEDQWFHQEPVCKMMEKKARKMSKPPKIPIFSTKYNHFIAALPNDKYKGATIYHYKKGQRINDNF